MSEDVRIPSGWDSPLAQRYRLDGLLGRGSMADVHQAEDTLLRREVAIKLFHPDPDPLTRQRFTDEARVLAQLSHPGLVSIYDAGIDDTQPYLVIQLVEGESLRSRLLSGPVTPTAVTRLGSSLAAAISHVHECGIVHRDIKPANIMLDTEGDPYLADFGIAQLIGAAELTDATEIVGTAAYLAPEQIRGTRITPAADIYALGLVLLECLTGKPVYPATGNGRPALTRLHRTPRIPSTVPPHLAALLATMTDTEAARRPTAQQCAGTLRLLHSRPPPDQTPPHRPQTLARRSRRPYLIGAGVIAAAAAALALTLSPRTPASGQLPSSAGLDQTTSHTTPSAPAAAPVTADPATAVPRTTRDKAKPVRRVTRVPVAPTASTDPRLVAEQPSNTTAGPTSDMATTTTAAPTPTTTAAPTPTTAGDPPTT